MSTLPPDPQVNPDVPVKAFRYFCQSVLPAVYDDSLSYYELLCKLTAKINEIISADTTQVQAIEELQQLYIDLKQYVDNYFTNLDVQTEINNKLDDMARQGTLAEIIAQYLDAITLIGFNTLADLKAAQNLSNGLICKTLGTSTYSTGDGHYYYIRNKTNEDVIDEDNIVAITASATIIAEKIPDKFINDLNTSVTDINTNIGDLTTLTTTEKSNLVGAINENVTAISGHTTKIGDLSTLTTTEKTNLVGAVNENVTSISGNTSKIGDLSSLTTTNKTNIVSGVNEVNGKIGALSDLSTQTKTNIVASINELNTNTIPISRGGTNATTAQAARSNLGVMTQYVLYDSLQTPSQEPTNGNIDFTDKLTELNVTLNDFKYLDFYFSNRGEGVVDDGMCMTRVYNWEDPNNVYFNNSISLGMQGSRTVDTTTYFVMSHAVYHVGYPDNPSKAILVTSDDKTQQLSITKTGDVYSTSMSNDNNVYIFRVVGHI